MLAERGLGMGLVQYKLRGSGNGTCTVQAVKGYMQYKLRRGIGNGTTYVYMSNILCFMFMCTIGTLLVMLSLLVG